MRFLFQLSAFLLCVSHALSSPPRVVAVSPTPQSTTAERNAPILITFDVPVDPATVHSGNISVFGKWSGVVQGTFQMENNDTRIRFTPTRFPSAGDWVTVSLSRGIRSQAGDSLAKGYAWNYWVKTQQGTLNLVELGRIAVRRQGEPHIQTYGAHGADLNNDGFSDFFVPNELSNDCRVFLNNGSGYYSSFTVHPIPNGSRPSTNESADFNADGNMDIAVGNSTGDSVTVFLGNGSGGFLSIRNYQAAGGIRGLSVADLDGDGDADIVTANRSGNNIAILLNNGNGTFGPRTVMEANGNAETACAMADANGDGVLDLFVGAYASNEIILLLGNGTGGFTYSTKVAAGGSGPWMIAVGDMNRDGNVDVVSANSGSANCAVILGNGAGGLAPAVTYPTGSFPLAIDVGDIDGDGDLDLVTSNYSGGNWSVYENNGSGVLINRRTLPSSRAGSCATLHDRDNDGDMDMTGIDEIDDLIVLFENRPPTSVAMSAGPAQVALYPNMPNPFNPTTSIRYDLAQASDIELLVTDLRGRHVRTLKQGRSEPGTYTVQWDGADSDGRAVASGVYFCRLQVKTSSEVSFTAVRKLLLIR
jgi:hypothetical protein